MEYQFDTNRQAMIPAPIPIEVLIACLMYFTFFSLCYITKAYESDYRQLLIVFVHSKYMVTPLIPLG